MSTRGDAPHTAIEMPSDDQVDGSQLQQKPIPQKTRLQRWKEHGDQKLGDSLLTFILYWTAFATGVLDATTYADFRTFASNQTGNTILLTLAIVGTVPVQIGLTGASLGAYILFSFVCGRLGHHFGERKRSWLLVSSILQISLLIVALILVHIWGIQYGYVTDRRGWAVMFFLAASSGVQVAMARTVGISEVPTAMLSSPLVDLLTDPNLFRFPSHPAAVPRNRRAIYIVSIISGSFVGACAHRYAGTECAIYVAVGIKVCVAVWVTLAKSPMRFCMCLRGNQGRG